MGTVTAETLIGRHKSVKTSETVISNLTESQGNPELTDKRKRRLERNKKKLEKQENGLKNNDQCITDQKNITNEAASLEEKRVAEREKKKNEDRVYRAENSLSNCKFSVEVCQQAWDCSREASGAEKLHTGQTFPTGEDSQPYANMSRSKRKRLRRRERKKEQERNALKDNGVDCHTTNAEVVAKCHATHVSEVVGSKLMSIKEKSAVSVISESSMSLPNDVIVQQQDTGAKADATVSEMENPKAKKRKRKRTKAMKVSAPLGNTLEASEDNKAVQSLLDHSSRKVMGNNDGNCGRGLACSELASKEENSASAKKSGAENLAKTKLVNRENETNTEVSHDVLGTQGVSNITGKKRKRNRKKKKKKKCHADDKTGNIDSKNEMAIKTIEVSIGGTVGTSSIKDVSVPRKDEEREVDREEAESCVSRYVVAQDSVAQVVFSGGIGKQFPRCICHGHFSKKLLVLDLNGILADVVLGHPTEFCPDGKISGRSVFRRPFVDSFLEFCFERFDVGIWSSRRKGLYFMIQMVMKNYQDKLLFWMDWTKCTKTRFKTLENDKKPLVMKDLRKVWDRLGFCGSCRKRKYDETNTLLVDDSPYKALCNPPHAGVFPYPYQHTDREDFALGPKGDLRLYLERLADAENIQKFVEENPFGQPTISESHPSWEFYSKVLRSRKQTQVKLPESSKNVSDISSRD